MNVKTKKEKRVLAEAAVVEWLMEDVRGVEKKKVGRGQEKIRKSERVASTSLAVELMKALGQEGH